MLEGLPPGRRWSFPDSFYNYHRTCFDQQLELGRLGDCGWSTVTDTDAVLAALPGADLLWLELPTNPRLGVPDLPRWPRPPGKPAC